MDLRHFLELASSYHTDINDNKPELRGISVLKREAPSNIEAYIYEPVICLILQGSKVTSIGDQQLELCPGDALLVSHDLPVVSKITSASTDKPYIAAIMTIDLGVVRSLYDQLGDAVAPSNNARSLNKGTLDPAWLEPLVRYFLLKDNQLDASVLGPAIYKEIHYRLLLSPIGKMLQSFLLADSHASKIAKAIKMLRSGYRTSISVSQLAKAAGMSASSFHDHFKTVTGTSPLQYQKDLRLIEAKTILAIKGSSVSETAFSVGYESSTHFSRDYSRKFGVPPSREGITSSHRM